MRRALLGAIVSQLVAMGAAGARARAPTVRDAPLARRRVLLGAPLAALHAAALATVGAAGASDVDAQREARRAELLRLIASGAPDERILAQIDALVPYDPSRGRGAVDGALAGTWDLLWTKDEAPAAVQLVRKTLHQPVGTQLLGDAAAPRFGAGRVAQLLDVGAVRFELSSGATPAPDDARVLQIFPPFRFDALVGGRRLHIAATDDDAGFRRLNARSAEAIAAPRNRYAQLYLDVSGSVGDLRVSRIVEGDSAIVGNVYIHSRIPDGAR
ncbi:hypothetical protein KFE25_006554 [Diacronema lutheri]|uniref:Plastid lipid-associated protein/fibrillin conserved domain-containing protein n=2 Tax=Diacronema lutheri TaxID=2081491 RepID=A0A8J6C347_DIALT|nr:hypothetical protein KFE25_006554 [Diacronema lutheri]